MGFGTRTYKKWALGIQCEVGPSYLKDSSRAKGEGDLTGGPPATGSEIV